MLNVLLSILLQKRGGISEFEDVQQVPERRQEQRHAYNGADQQQEENVRLVGGVLHGDIGRDEVGSLRSAIEGYAPSAQIAIEEEQVEEGTSGEREKERVPSRSRTVYGRQEIRAHFEHSPLAITLLFTSGVLLEIAGVVLWALTSSVQVGAPLFIAGFVAVVAAVLVRRQRR